MSPSKLTLEAAVQNFETDYRQRITEAMTWLGQQADTVFIGQQCRYPGNAMFQTLEGVSIDKRVEMPVAEDMQMGLSLGMALTGKVVISIFPRMDFLMCAMNQLVNHVDKLSDFTHGQWQAKVIVRVGIGSRYPMDPGCQHCGDYEDGLRRMLRHMDIRRIRLPKDAMPIYREAYMSPILALIIEEMELYD